MTAGPRRNSIAFWLLSVTIGLLLAANVAQWFANRTDTRQSSDIASLLQTNKQRIKAGRQALLDGCRRSNHSLRLVINRNIVRPLNDALEAAAVANPDAFAPIFEELATVPYSICRNAYPLHGKPHPPFFRRAPLPKPRVPHDAGSGTGLGGPVSSSSPSSSSSSAAAPTSSPPSTDGSTGGDSSGGSGDGSQGGSSNPPAQPGPPGPQGPPGSPPPADPPGPLDPVTDPVCQLTGLCL